MTHTREDIELYLMGAYDGDSAALERALADDAELRALVTEEARFEEQLREAAAAARFCPGCRDLVRGARCDACGVALEPGGYVVERVLVKSAHGRMYVARDADRKLVALKELAFVQSPTLDMIAAFEREAKMLRALEHPAIPRFVASFEEGAGVHTRYYLAQELVAGEPLDAHLESHFFTEREAIELARNVLEVLTYLQSLSPMVIHRDIKPANLIKRANGGPIAVVDFGAAHVQGTTVGSTSIGTFGYMPIEQLAGIVDATTDVYALGATLVHLLSRKEPWRLLSGLTLDPLNISPAFRAFLGKLVAPRPADRFANAAAALAALERLGKEEAPVAVVPVAPARPRRSRRTMAIALIAGLGALGVGTGAAIAWFSSEDAPPPVAVVTPTPQIEEPRVMHLPDGIRVVVDYQGAPLHAAMRELAKHCDVTAVVPDYVDGAVTLRKSGPCGDVIDALLRSRGLEPVYRDNVLRVASPHDDAPLTGPLPVFPAQEVDLDFENAPVRDLLTMLAGALPNTRVELPADLDVKVTVVARKAPWQAVFTAIVDASGLAMRYSASDHMLSFELRDHPEARKPPGKLIVVNSPRTADIYVDGRLVGKTPIAVSVSAGRHKVSFVVGSDRYTFTADVGPEQIVTLHKNF
jgi:protein kinase-like protein/PEGA domain-containing protein